MKKLSQVELNDIFAHLRLGEILEIEEQTEGDVNQVYKVRSNDKSYIIRLNTKEEFNKFKLEHECYQIARKLEIPSPQVLDIGTYNDNSYMLLEFIPSKKINTEIVWEKLGEYTKIISTVKELEGQNQKDREGWFYKKYLDYNIKAFYNEDFILAEGLVKPANYKKLKDRFRDLSQQGFQFGLTHGDIAPDNCIYGQDNKIYLIDWSCANIHIVPEFEVVNTYIRWKLEEKISKDDMQAYLKGAGLGENYLGNNWFKIESLIYLYLIDKLRWAKDNDKKENYEWYKKLLTIFENLARDERY